MSLVLMFVGTFDGVPVNQQSLIAQGHHVSGVFVYSFDFEVLPRNGGVWKRPIDIDRHVRLYFLVSDFDACGLVVPFLG